MLIIGSLALIEIVGAATRSYLRDVIGLCGRSFISESQKFEMCYSWHQKVKGQQRSTGISIGFVNSGSE